MKSVPRRSRSWRRLLLRWARRTKDVGTFVRAQVVAHATAGRSVQEITELLGCVRAHVYRTVKKYLRGGRRALLDGRRFNGERRVDGAYEAAIAERIRGSPLEHGFARPTWTRELLIIVAEQHTGTRVSLAVMSRVLQRLRARRGRPKPMVRCPLSERQRRRRLRRIEQLLDRLPPNEVAVYEDEADIHLNPKIGLDWMPRGYQKQVVTAGQNQKAYVAGALDVQDGTVTWVGGGDKASGLFIELLHELERRYEHAERIHVIVDNCSIHSSTATVCALRCMPRIRLWFLPPYGPDHNRIERLWQDLHANVTRNHRHNNLFDLCQDVAAWLDAASAWPARPSPARTAESVTPTQLAL